MNAEDPAIDLDPKDPAEKRFAIDRIFKRALEYFYNGQSSRYVCEGDSGGPVFVGSLQDNGPIVRVHSGRSATGVSIGADPVRFRDHIVSMVNAMENPGPEVCDGSLAGTVGEKRRMEAIKINLLNPGPFSGVRYRVFIPGRGWTPFVENNQVSGTTGRGRRIEAVQIELF